MSKKLFVVLFLFTSTSAAIAQDAPNPTVELLRARPAQHFVRIGLVPKGDTYELQYGVDTFDNLDPLTSGIVLRTNDGAEIYLALFNPLTQTYTINSEATPDVSYASLKAFLEDLQKAQANLAPKPAVAGGLEDAAKAVTACSELLALVDQLHAALEDKELNTATVEQIVEGAAGFNGVKKAVNDLALKKQTIDANVSEAEEALKTLRTDFSALAGGAPKKNCLGEIQKALTNLQNIDAASRSANDNKTIDLLQDQVSAVEAAQKKFAGIAAKADDIIAAKKKLSASIGEILKGLQKYNVELGWRGPNLSDWDLNQKIRPNFVSQQKVTVVAKAMDVVLDEKNVLVVKDVEKSKQTADFRMRQDSLFIPERAVAVLYNRLKYPKYTAGKNKDGKTVVQKTEDENPWNGALLLNLVMRLRSTSVAYPMIQLGVSTAKDYPGLVAGFGLRFTEPVAIGISFGGMITRYKDLDNQLRVDTEVTDQAEIEKHIVRRTSPVVPYLAIQVKF